ncbi:hypothetical protein F8388_004299 [Cannabis sativa]|uniref:Reverse transcriptase zinc-binding domain-containing protein n=1 Tax=Cannabis sativa TaxID=3483 RepID=A0A7J6HBS4_CANSA|nr:hypothetical protein F8388_004299 [Cannabis sativa]
MDTCPMTAVVVLRPELSPILRDVHATIGSGAASTGTNDERKKGQDTWHECKGDNCKVGWESDSKKRKAVGNVSPILIQTDDSVNCDNEVSKTREVGGTFSMGSSSPAAKANNSKKFGSLMENVRTITPGLTCVADLLYRRSRSWNTGYLRFLFGNVLGEEIGKIQIVKNGEEDFIVWKNSKLGNFSVKGAYWDAQLHRFGDANRLWGWIWNAKVHPCLSMMLWRVCANTLPTGDIFNQLNHNNCCFCGASCEIPMHLFARCSFANALWFGCPFPVRIDTIQDDSVAGILRKLCEAVDEDLRWEVSDTNVSLHISTNLVLVVDGSFSNGRYGCGALAFRNDSSDWFFCSSYGDCGSALAAELEAILFGIKWALDTGWDRVSIASGTMQLVNAFRRFGILLNHFSLRLDHHSPTVLSLVFTKPLRMGGLDFSVDFAGSEGGA